MGRGGQARDIYTWTQKVGRPVTDGLLLVNKVTRPFTFFLSKIEQNVFGILIDSLRDVSLVKTLFKVGSTKTYM